LTKGSIYGNFENKDDVALAAFDHNYSLIVEYLRKQIELCPNMVDRLLVYPKPTGISGTSYFKSRLPHFKYVDRSR
jgi:AcrR family transcriptional regulator